MNKKLKNLIELSSSVQIYIPSTIDVNKEIDPIKYVDETLSYLSTLFGGATSFKAMGCWQSENAGLVKEKVIICKSFCNQSALENHIDSIISYCEKLKDTLSQEAISLEINNKLYFI